MSNPPNDFLRRRLAPLDYRFWHGLCFFTEHAPPPPWGNQVWAGLVTARARVRLLGEMLRVRRAGGRVLYCDTDSLVFSGRGPRYPDKALSPGDFELRGRYKQILIIGKKEYALEDQYGRWLACAKGVPSSARLDYLHTGRATFDRPTRFREATRTGATPNVWLARTKVRHQDHRFRAASDGTLAIPWRDASGVITFRHDGGESGKES